MIEFLLEDGTGLAAATSYASVAGFEQYFENKGTTFTQADETIQAWLNDATEYADNNYRWGGSKFSTTQALKVPRSNWTDCEGTDISESVPTELAKGIYELAYARKGASSINTGSKVDNTVSSKSIGGLSVSYRGAVSTLGVLSYPKADKWFSCLDMQPVGRVCRV